jgi:hypothetical protein
VLFCGDLRFLIFDFVIFQKPGEFTRFSPGFQISPSFHQKKNGEFTRFFHQVFHQVLEIHQIQPKFHRKTHKFHQEKRKNASFGEIWRCKTLLCFFLVKTW